MKQVEEKTKETTALTSDMVLKIKRVRRISSLISALLMILIVLLFYFLYPNKDNPTSQDIVTNLWIIIYNILLS